MKSIFFLVSILAALASINLKAEPILQIGQACGTNSIFQISSFTLDPWPPTPGTIAQYTMTGTFTQAERISQIHEAFFTPQQTNYIDVDVDISYNAGQTTSFVYGVQYGYLPGNYKIQWYLQNGGSTFISCWQVSYTIN